MCKILRFLRWPLIFLVSGKNLRAIWPGRETLSDIVKKNVLIQVFFIIGSMFHRLFYYIFFLLFWTFKNNETTILEKTRFSLKKTLWLELQVWSSLGFAGYTSWFLFYSCGFAYFFLLCPIFWVPLYGEKYIVCVQLAGLRCWPVYD